MDLKDIAAVSGKGGLFKILKPTRTGVILEAIDESKVKLIANANSRVSILKEISVYTTGKEASTPLENVFTGIFEKYGKDLKIDSKANDKELKNFLESVVPNFDTEKVYTSDIKKIISWYNLLIKNYPDIFVAKKEEVKEEKVKEEKVKEVKKTAKAEKSTEKPKKEAASGEEKPKAKAKASKKKEE